MKLMLTALAELYEKVNFLVESEYEKERERTTIRELQEDKNKELLRSIQDLQAQTHNLEQTLCLDTKAIKTELEEVQGNISHRLGKYFAKHPKVVWALLAGYFILMNLWFIAGFRQAVLTILHVPPEIISLVNPQYLSPEEMEGLLLLLTPSPLPLP